MLNVLIVDDAPEIRSRLGRMLRALPEVEVVGCAAGAGDALALAETTAPDVVVLDVALRGGDRGYAVLTDLLQRCPDTQVIVLSNFGWGAMREGFLRGGACAYFDKAFEFRKAIDWIAAEATRRSGLPTTPAH